MENDRPNTATPATRDYIDSNAENWELSKAFLPNDQEETVDDAGDDDSWINNLTPYQPEQVAPEPVNNPASYPPVTQDNQQQNLQDLYKSLNSVDEEVAEEVYSKLINPNIERVRTELEELKRQQQAAQSSQTAAILNSTNAKIMAKYPKAMNILRSSEFVDFVNQKTDRYARETQHEILSRAYYSGDADYVIKQMDDFVQSRGKPKPPVGVEPQRTGGQSNVSGVRSSRRPMSEQEYLRARHKIRSAPRGTYPSDALTQLYNEYQNSNGRK